MVAEDAKRQRRAFGGVQPVMTTEGHWPGTSVTGTGTSMPKKAPASCVAPFPAFATTGNSANSTQQRGHHAHGVTV